MTFSLMTTRLCLLAAVALCFTLGIIQSTIWNGEDAPTWILSLPAIHTASAFLYKIIAEPIGLTDYYFFGRMFFLVYLGLFAGLKNWRKNSVTRQAILFKIFTAALLIALIGDFIAYWGGGWFGTDVRFVGFWLVEVPALAIASLSSLVFGIQLLRQKSTSTIEAMTFAGAPVFVLISTASFQYMPHGPVFGILLIVLVLSFLQNPKPPK
ncbi:MAG: hypothetical protein KUG61_09635 [Parvibaculaceae bacterium]|nr:hypothetical protein [Parvibaculaceae bacterium]